MALEGLNREVEELFRQLGVEAAAHSSSISIGYYLNARKQLAAGNESVIDEALQAAFLSANSRLLHILELIRKRAALKATTTP